MSLTANQEDALREVINIGIGRAAASLSDLVGTRIELTVPDVTLVEILPASVLLASSGPCIQITQDFEGKLAGARARSFPHNSGLKLALLLSGQDQPLDELDLELSSILTEVGNIVLNGVLGSLANVTNDHLQYSVPLFKGEHQGGLGALFRAAETKFRLRSLLLANAEFRLKQRSISGDLLLIFERGRIEGLLDELCAGVPS